MARRVHETIAFQRNAGVGEEVFDFRVNDRVMTVDGFPGHVVARNSGPFPSSEDYEVVLDGGMGGGSYTAAQLRKINPNTAALHEAVEVTSSIPVEAITTHTADVDYPELGTILQERQPNENVKLAKLAANQDQATKPQSSQEDPSQRMDQQDSEENEEDQDENNTDTAPDDEPGPPDLEEEKEKNAPDVTPPSACSFCGSDAFEDPQMTGRGVRMRCSQCGGTMKSWGGQWEPEFPNSSQNAASGQSDWSQGGAAGVANAPGANFKTTKLQIDASIINWVVDKIYNRIEERKNHEMLGPEWAWQTGLEGAYNHQTNYADYDCPSCHGIHPQSLHPEGLSIHGSLASEYDSEWKFHFTASWSDVQAKAKRIRKEGGVKILVATNMGVAGEVKGEHNVYETQLNYVLGTKHVADWACGCKWASYSWGRSPAYRRFEARLCSHALALQYEASARGMFGKEIQPDTDRPTWQKAHQPVQVQYQRPTDRAPEKDLRRRAVPPGNMKRTFGALGDDYGHPHMNQDLFNKNSDYRMGYGHGAQGEQRYADEAQARVDVQRHDQNDIDYLVGHAHGTQHGRDSAEKTHQINKMWEAAPEHLGLEHQIDLIGREMGHEGSLDTDGIYESPELLELHHAPIFASVQAMANAGEPTENIIEMVASHEVTREAAKEMIFEAFHADEDGFRRDGDEYATPDGDRFNHGDPKDKSDWGDPEFVRANTRDLTDHDGDHADDEHKKRHHNTNDAREHAPHWGWGLPAGVPIETCSQCNGSGCGHCAGQGQIVSDQTNLSATSPDQTSDAGDVVSGLATNGTLHTADYLEGGKIHFNPGHGGPACGAGARWDASQITTTKGTKRVNCGSCVKSKAYGEAANQKTADYSSNDPLAGVDQQNYYSPTNHSNTRNPASTGWASSQDPGDWGQSVITNNFGLTTDSALDSAPTVAGVLLRANDTGRLLMIQRALDEKDPASGMWEPPGGHLEDGEKPLNGAVREFEEETGHRFPQDAEVLHTWRSGPYRGHLVSVPSEQHLDFSQGRQIENPDGDIHEHVAWWDPQHAKKNPALRKEMKGAPWDQFKKAADKKVDLDYGDGGSMFEHRFAEPGHADCPTCARPLLDHEKPEGQCEDCLTAHEAPDFSGGHAQHVDRETGQKFVHRFDKDWNPQGYELHRLHTNSRYLTIDEVRGISDAETARTGKSAEQALREHVAWQEQYFATLVNDPDEVGALPYTTGEADGDVFPGQTGGSSSDSSMPQASSNALHLAFLDTPGAQAMMADLGITKSAMKDFSYAEQQDLINEGHGARARNFNDLKIAGTHYEHLKDEDDGDLFL